MVMYSERALLKELLAESFLAFAGIRGKYDYLSTVIDGEAFRSFVAHICEHHAKFREAFNRALDDYRAEFRFRFKNYPFPRLEEGEVPFWKVSDGVRERCFAGDTGALDDGSGAILPRAAALTMFLRLRECDLFLHGVGGANYEWVVDRVIERFFGAVPPPYAVASGTFLLPGFAEREFPYFFFDPGRIRECLAGAMGG
jgi:hypothetical protein